MKKQRVQVPKWMPLALVVAGACIVMLGGWVLLLSPKQRTIADLHSQTAAVEQQVSADLARAATARNGTGAPTIRVADIYKLQTAMPSATDMPDLLLELDQTAKAAGVQLQSIAPSPTAAPAAGAAYETIPITLTAAGNFYSVTDLLYRLRNLVYVRGGALEANGRIFTVSGVALSPNGKLVTANITLATYVYGPPAAPAPAPVAPGSTTTTTATATTTTTTSSSSGPSAAGAGTP